MFFIAWWFLGLLEENKKYIFISFGIFSYVYEKRPQSQAWLTLYLCSEQGVNLHLCVSPFGSPPPPNYIYIYNFILFYFILFCISSYIWNIYIYIFHVRLYFLFVCCVLSFYKSMDKTWFYVIMFFFSPEENKTQSFSLSLPPFHKLTKWSSTFIMWFSIFD